MPLKTFIKNLDIKNTSHKTQWIFISLLSFLLIACGFHLRGLEKMPPVLNHLYIETNTPAPVFLPKLEAALQNNEVILVNNSQSASSILIIQNFQTSKQLLSLSGTTEAGQYTLTTSVSFSLETPDGKTLMGPIDLSAERLYSTNAMQVLSTGSIESRLNLQMSEELANKVLNYLSKYKYKSK